ncbi:FAD-dependent oxidoreductase [Paenibacillus silvae]|uniref:FAD-dependent oxidoreductase n=1 Tax=Paenibacillus silvae TaxID=1325358 RepID=A0ABQ1Z7U5_9BACL|nr:NAD(P)/FAD-dependent oxidoreductase [Paenibacillus silvae]GGH52691.1 FAD-dependent oxidoreductase [Paenibacillus silvae]
MTRSSDVIVIGAGIAGSACSIELARQGHRTLLLDRQQFPRHKTCGEFMSPETREMLEHLGVDLLDCEKTTGLMHHASIILPDGGEIEAPLPGTAYGISRYVLDQLLHKQARDAGADIITKANIIATRQLENKEYEVEVKQGDEYIRYHAKAVIGAHGSKKLRGTESGEGLRDETIYVGVKSHYRGIRIPARVELYFCNGGYVGISPIENDTVNVAALLTLDSVQGSGKSVPEIMQAAALTNTRLAARLSEGGAVQGTQVSVAPLQLSNVPEPWSSYPHIGDAMLVIPPLCGDGMSIALRSAILCARWTDAYLKDELHYDAWQSEYTREANREFAPLLRRARTIQQVAFARTNRFYPALARMFPGLASYVVRATRLSGMR